MWAFDRIAKGWEPLLPMAANAQAAAPNGNVIAVFLDYGTYYRASDETWTRLPAYAAGIVAIDRLGNAYANFAGYGTYLFRPVSLMHGANVVGGWERLGYGTRSANKLTVAANGDLVANVVADGVWRYRPAVGWTQLRRGPAAALAVGDNGQLKVTFTAVVTGVYRWRDGPFPGWETLHGYNATNLAADRSGNVTATFNSPARRRAGGPVAGRRVRYDSLRRAGHDLDTDTPGAGGASDP